MVTMSPNPGEPALRISPKLRESLVGIDEQPLQENVYKVVLFCMSALEELNKIHLPHDTFEDSQSDGSDSSETLIPYVHGALEAIISILNHLVESFPAPPVKEASPEDDDFDFDFDLVDEAAPAAKPDDESGAAATTPFDECCDAANAYGGMLRSRMTSFAERLRFALGQDDPWVLMAEVDDYKHRLIKAVQAVLFGIIGVFAKGVRYEELLPEYQSSVSQSITLRSAVTDLGYHTGRFNSALNDADDDMMVPLIVGLAERLAAFCSQPVYRSMRAEDKKAVMDFRRELNEARHNRTGVPAGAVRRMVEGFSKFLDSLQAINHREVLVLHDRGLVEKALGRLQQVAAIASSDPEVAGLEFNDTLDSLQQVYGRSPDLDEALRSQVGGAAEVSAVMHWLQLLQATLPTIG